jgi:O-Antigen ligase
VAKIAIESKTPAYRWLNTMALVLALALVTSRCLTGEFLRDPSEVMPGATSAPRGVGAAVGVMLDLACCLPALLVLLNQSLTRARRRTGWASALFLAFATFAAISFCWASDRYSAAVGACHLLAAGALLWAISQIVHDWQSGAGVAAMCLGLLLCYLAQGIYYETVDLPDLRDRWVNDVGGTRTKLLQQHNWAEGSFPAKQFALKILHGDLATFFNSANTFAAMLALLGVVVTGLFLSRARERKSLALLVLPIPFFWLLWLTQCKAAFVTLALAFGIFFFLHFASPILSRFRKTIYFLFIAIFLAGIALTVQYGLRHGNLHNDSLNFRWRYWVAASHIFREHPLLGVGWNSFGEHYLAVRLPAAPEEIKDPHNMLVRTLTELGIIGGGLFIAFLATAWWRMTQSTFPSSTDRGVITARSLMAAVVLALLINLSSTIDYSQISAYVFIEVIRRFLYLGLLLIAIIFVLNTRTKQLAGSPMKWFPAAIAIGLCLFLIHNLIDFAIFDPSPGPLMLFALLTGTLIGIRSDQTAPAKWPWLRFGICTTIFLAAAGGFVTPLVLADADVQQADDLFRAGKMDQAIPLYSDARRLVPYNPEYPLRQAEALVYNNAARPAIDAAIDTAVASDMRFTEAYLLRARYLQRQPTLDGPAITEAYQHALALDPNEVTIRLEFADALKNLGKPQDAVEQYQKALWYNDQFPPDEAKRLSSDQLAQINQTIKQLSEH